MGPGAADIAEIVPELRHKLTDLETPPVLEPEQARYRLFSSITNFLKNAAQSQPLMLVLEDLHWADQPSLLVLQFLVREMGGSRLLVVGTYRDVEVSRQHPLSDTLAQLSREPVFRRELLRGLSRQDTGDFVEVAAGLRPPPGLVESIYLQTEGNPFFIGEVIRMLAEQGELGEEDIGRSPSIRIPEGVREVIGQRLNRLSAHCNQTLVTAAVNGREFDFRLLSALSDGISDGISESQLLEAIDEGLEAHLLEELTGGLERYQFSHALIQETLSEELSTSRKARLHARISEALEEIYGPNVEAHPAELAYHCAEAETILGTEKLVRYSLLAGERALTSHAYEDAVSHLERGLVARGIVLSGTEASPDEEAAALLFGLARARLAMSQRSLIQEIILNLSRAFNYYAEAGEVARAVAVAECPLPGWPGNLKGMAQLVSRALALVAADSHPAGHKLCLYGKYLGTEEGDYEGAQEAFGRALAIAYQERDVALEMRTLADAGRVGNRHRRPQEALAKCLEALELASRVDDPRTELEAHYGAVTALTEMGGLEGMPRHASAMLPLAERLRDRYWLGVAYRNNVLVCWLRGDWRAAREFGDRGFERGWRTSNAFASRASLEYQAGDFGQGEVYLERLLELWRISPPDTLIMCAHAATAIPMAARITGLEDRLETADAAARTILSSPSASPQYATMARSGLALIAIQRDDVTGAEEQYNALQWARGTLIPEVMAIDHLLGLLAQTIGRLEDAMDHFEDALAFCRKAGWRPELAWTCHDYADALLQRASASSAQVRHGDRGKAIGLLDESLAISQELGMPPLMERVAECLARAKSQPDTIPAYPDGLTRREVEVLRLIALGRSDRDIAGELVLSTRTPAEKYPDLGCPDILGKRFNKWVWEVEDAGSTVGATRAAGSGSPVPGLCGPGLLLWLPGLPAGTAISRRRVRRAILPRQWPG